MDTFEKIRHNLSEKVAPSVVIVQKQNPKSDKFVVGCVVHKTATDTFILTKSKVINRTSKVRVRFHDKTEQDASWLIGDSEFAVLHLGVAHGSSTSIHFHHGPIGGLEAMCIVPKPPLSFQCFWGPILRPSCASTRDDGTVVPNMYFLYQCHHEETELMTPSPVFHKNEGVSGFIVGDCMTKDETGYPVDQHVKLCMKAIAVEEALQTMLQNVDWKGALENFPQN